MNISKFKYYNNPGKDAIFTEKKCQFCGTDEHCLEGEYFERGDDVVSACLHCLSEGKITVYIPDYIIERVIKNLNELDKENKTHINKERGKNLAKELSKNPPVPWIQYNDWPVCCNDFGRYLGEWDKEEIVRNASDENVKQYFMSIIDDFSRSKIDNYDYLWDDIGKNTIIFVFECIHCSKIIAICQSY